MRNAQKNGRLYTAKELAEVEDKVYARVNVMVSYGDSK